MTWVSTLVSAASALLGGFVGGWLVAFRLGGWRQRVEDHLAGLDSRLDRDSRAMDTVPVLATRVELILEELRTMRAEMRRDREQFVSHEECDRRHQNA